MREFGRYFRDTELPQKKEIELSLKEHFPINLTIKDDLDRVVDIYRIVKTKGNKFMLQK